MNLHDALWIGGLLGGAFIAVLLRLKWEDWRRWRLYNTGNALGLRPAVHGQRVLFPRLPSIGSRPLIGGVLQGEWKGHGIMEFDLFRDSGTSFNVVTAFLLDTGTGEFPRFHMRRGRAGSVASRRQNRWNSH
jgi:hypothetical protein